MRNFVDDNYWSWQESRPNSGRRLLITSCATGKHFLIFLSSQIFLFHSRSNFTLFSDRQLKYVYFHRDSYNLDKMVSKAFRKGDKKLLMMINGSDYWKLLRTWVRLRIQAAWATCSQTSILPNPLTLLSRNRSHGISLKTLISNQYL